MRSSIQSLVVGITIATLYWCISLVIDQSLGLGNIGFLVLNLPATVVSAALTTTFIRGLTVFSPGFPYWVLASDILLASLACIVFRIDRLPLPARRQPIRVDQDTSSSTETNVQRNQDRPSPASSWRPALTTVATFIVMWSWLTVLIVALPDKTRIQYGGSDWHWLVVLVLLPTFFCWLSGILLRMLVLIHAQVAFRRPTFSALSLGQWTIAMLVVIWLIGAPTILYVHDALGLGGDFGALYAFSLLFIIAVAVTIVRIVQCAAWAARLRQNQLEVAPIASLKQTERAVVALFALNTVVTAASVFAKQL